MENQDMLYNQRHSLAHLLAQAVQRTFDAWATLGIWPAIENGMYYDFLFSEGKKLEETTLKDIGKMMQKICKENQPFHRIELTYDQAKQIIEMLWEELKIELIDEFKAQWETVFSYYVNTINEAAKDKLLAGVDPEYTKKYQKITDFIKAIPQFKNVIEGNFVTFLDMCKWPHVENTKEINVDAFALEKIAGAYWRGDSNNVMMTRIYGLAFASKEELKNYQMMMEEARKRDHKVLGKKFDLFSFSEYGPGFPFFHNNGMIIINELQKYWRETHTRDGYEEIKTPIMLNKSLWEVSGHRWYYKENMYISEIDEQEFAIKPMNCPGWMLVYKTTPKSYRDLPLKAGEFGQVHRHEMSGTLNGLFRVRTFTQDDAHIFCTKDQFKQEIKNVIDLIFEMYACFGFEKVNIELSTRPEKYVWDIADRDIAEENLKEALAEKNIPYQLNEGDGAFYGPKIDFKILDAIWREWQCGTVQLDFALPKRFELEYIAEDGSKQTPIMLHRVVYGSLERFFGILIEHFAGAFPLWLAPTQIQIVPVAEKFNDYASKIKSQMVAAGLRTRIDDSDDSFSKKIRNAELMKVPYILIVWEKEESDNSVSVRVYKTKEQLTMKVEDFINEKVNEYKERSL
jgi:threonyl-tRNA synthetase